MRLRRTSISTVVTIALVATVTVLLAVPGFIAYRAIRAERLGELAERHARKADELAVALTLPVWNFDRDQINHVLYGVMRDQNVAGIVVRLADEHKTTHARSRDANWGSRDGTPGPDTRVAVASRKVRGGSGDLATLDLFITSRFVEAELSRTRRAMILGIVALDFILVFVVRGMLWRLVVRPLRELEAHAGAISSGPVSPERFAGLRFRGELDRLRESIREMVALLNARYEALGLSERELRASEERLSSAMQNSPIGMALVGVDGRWLEVNPALCAIVGYTRDELLTMTFRDITHPGDSETDERRIRRLLAGEVESTQVEKRYIHKSGRIVWIQLNTTIVWSHDAEPRHFVSQIQDITERLRVEEQMRQTTKLEAIGRLAGGIAHDFNNILMVVLGHARVIAAREGAPADVRSAAAEIVRSSDRATALTRQLLAFSRRQPIELRAIHLDEAVASVCGMIQRLVGEDVAVTLVRPDDAVPVRADAGMIDQVLLNFAVNARDAMPDGGSLEIRTGVADVGETGAPGSRPGRFAYVSVTDTGGGIAPEHLPHVFEPFFTTKEVGRGTGLGLATTYGIAQQHGGWVEVDSIVGRGSTFRVYLPLADRCPESNIQAPVARPVAAPGGGETILLVEDENAVRDLVADFLGGQGYRVVQAATGHEALDLWDKHSIDLVLTDVVMPDGMTGFDLANKLEAMRPGVPIIYTSGYPAGTVGSDGTLKEGVNYLAKPYNLADLARALRALLGVPAAKGTAR
ncbi:MAG TPA: PAS domain S-box protein [Vicinamibacterales bacterium]|nr:PAS domain S-box protein [Vicinamibacterales bacterium]